MKLFKKIIRIIFFMILLASALGGVGIGNLYARKRDDLFDNEIKIEKVEERKEKTELPKMNELR